MNGNKIKFLSMMDLYQIDTTFTKAMFFGNEFFIKWDVVM